MSFFSYELLPAVWKNKIEHAVQSYAAGKTNKIGMLMEEIPMLRNIDAKQW